MHTKRSIKEWWRAMSSRTNWRPKLYTSWKLHDTTLSNNIGAMPDEQLAAMIGCSMPALRSRIKFLGLSVKGSHRLKQ